MSTDAKSRIGGMGCIILGVFAQFVADLHGFVSLYQGRLVVPSDIYLVIGSVGEPVLIVSILFVGI
ncbi:hypothetical protein [Spirochaeta thermophila]|uniref:Uncharacterized protein n=1 Tax=Winmispira thermophila (strain ATCC 49972 / DSM 6192 / RI 19.B1) TaxID=665571 RepID=E0RN19_WINT6|nr:hypothetical protein [Spirochaeta thermophila]ADN02488.1 hypothetical protein STHERM_c15480 [Spirochaeta thermophila DSM 6192]